MGKKANLINIDGCLARSKSRASNSLQNLSTALLRPNRNSRLADVFLTFRFRLGCVLGNVMDEIGDAYSVAPLIVIPGNDFHQVATNHVGVHRTEGWMSAGRL